MLDRCACGRPTFRVLSDPALGDRPAPLCVTCFSDHMGAAPHPEMVADGFEAPDLSRTWMPCPECGAPDALFLANAGLRRHGGIAVCQQCRARVPFGPTLR